MVLQPALIARGVILPSLLISSICAGISYFIFYIQSEVQHASASTTDYSTTVNVFFIILRVMQYACIFGLFTPLWDYLLKKNEYARTAYRVFPDRVEYETGFINRQTKTLLFRDIVDIYLYQGVVQRQYGLGTISLVARGGNTVGNRIFGFSLDFLPQTHASSDVTQQPANNLSLKNVPNPDRVYQQIRQLVNQAQQR